MTTPQLPHVTLSQEERLDQRRKLIEDVLVSTTVVTAWFSAVAMIGALVWVQVTTLPGFTWNGERGTMDELELSKQFSADGWFLVIAVVAGLFSGLILLLMRKSSPALMVGLIGLGGGLATWLMLACGLAWGPEDPNIGLAQASVGDVVPVQLQVDAQGIYYAWSIAALLGAAVAIWILEKREQRRNRGDLLLSSSDGVSTS